ncbi:hypothetical protein ACJ70E_12450 [Pseudomonas plecoglossicida]|uniref:hypothetical protein n=1 Tax=Pseudomonas plecoglossicida TaxID=70775 RepID=UPI00397732F0
MSAFNRRLNRRMRAIDDIREDKNFHSRKERLEAGKQLRDSVPRAAHAEWKSTSKHRDPVDLIHGHALH